VIGSDGLGPARSRQVHTGYNPEHTGDSLADAAVGSGEFGHGASRTFRDGKVVTLNEQWYGTSSDTHLLAAWGVSTDDEREVLLIDRGKMCPQCHSRAVVARGRPEKRKCQHRGTDGSTQAGRP